MTRIVALGGTVKPGVTREYGPAKLVVTDQRSSKVEKDLIFSLVT